MSYKGIFISVDFLLSSYLPPYRGDRSAHTPAASMPVQTGCVTAFPIAYCPAYLLGIPSHTPHICLELE